MERDINGKAWRGVARRSVESSDRIEKDVV